MRNIAKCKLCHSVIESFHSEDIIFCNCGEIGLYGGSAMRVLANNFDNLLRIDDEGNEIIVTVKENIENNPLANVKPTKAEMLDMLDEMIKNIERLPQDAILQPINHSDFCSLLLLLSSIFRSS